MSWQDIPQRLTDTPEWKALRDRVTYAPSLEVSYVLEASGSGPRTRNPRESLTIDATGQTYLTGPTTLTFGTANSVVVIDRQTGARINGAPLEAKFGSFAILGFLSAEALALEPTTMTRLTAQTVGTDGSMVTRVGWRWTETWIDTRQMFEVWFDPSTQFVDQVVTESSGMTLPVRRVSRFQWVVNPKISANIFVPRAIPIERPAPPPETNRCRFVRSPKWSEGSGRVIVRLPKNISGNIEINGRSTAMSRGSSLVVSLPIGPCMVTTDCGMQSVRVTEGYDAVVKFGVMQLRGKAKVVVSHGGSQLFTLTNSRRSIALYPGEYNVKSAGHSRTVEIKEGLVTKI